MGRLVTAASPFHEGEQQVQERLGVREAIEPWARKVVRPFLPEEHRTFYAQLPFVVVGPDIIRRAVDGPIAQRDLAGLGWLITVLLGAGALEFVLRAWHQWVLQVLGQRVMSDLRRKAFLPGSMRSADEKCMRQAPPLVRGGNQLECPICRVCHARQSSPGCIPRQPENPPKSISQR